MGNVTIKDRQLAREYQQQVERDRLLVHQQIGVEILRGGEQAERLRANARAEVARWVAQALCSDDYVRRWLQWLDLPNVKLVECMTSDADEWGTAMRQNSPFSTVRL